MKEGIGLLILVIICTQGRLFAQNNEPLEARQSEIKGTPRIIHYSRDDFESDPQVWCMTQDYHGIKYFGTNDGTLIFDGARWQNVQMPNNSSVRSMITTADGQVYVGGFNEFGTIKKDAFGRYSYQSLMSQLRPEDRVLENIWDIHEVQDHIIFRSFTMLVALHDEKISTVPVQNHYYSTVINDQLYLVDNLGIKILDLETYALKTIILPGQIQHQAVTEIIPGKTPDDLLIFTKPGAAYSYSISKNTVEFKKNYFDENSSNQILSVLKSSGGNLYLGTLSSEILVLDKGGEVIPIENDFMKLQDNTVHSLYESSDGNIWALLNNGIDCINITSPISVLFENASVFDVLIRGGKIYAATNQGVFVSEKIIKNPNFSSLRFTKIPGLEGAAWKLQVIEGEITVSHDRGVFIIDGENIIQLPVEMGTWKILPVRGKEHQYFICTYYGIYSMVYTPESGFEVLQRFEGFNESSRDIIQQDKEGVFWVCHGYKGVFKVQFDKNYERVISVASFQAEDFPSPFNINVFRWKNQIVFTTNTGNYIYDEQTNKFVPHKELNSIFGTSHNVRKLLEYEDQTWFVQNDEIGYFDEETDDLHKGLFLELKGTLNRGMECILPINTENVLIGTNRGLYAFDLSFQNGSHRFSTSITNISYRLSDSTLMADIHHKLELSSEINDLRFEFSAPQLKDQIQVQYSYQLEGLDEDWSDWTSDPYKVYTRLYPDNYTFKVKARSMIGEYANATGFSFEVLPVWYLTKWAFGVYVIIILLCIAASRKLVKKKIVVEKEKTRSEEKKKQNLLEMELQKIKLEREKELIEQHRQVLEEDVIFKSKELANYTMLLSKKQELLTELRDDLKELREIARNERSRNQLRTLVRKIGIHLNDEEHIHVFEANFERVHHAFFQELKTHFPDLTTKELRLCALVKMNLTNKEIAPILNISLRGVETARYRLRKRLSLEHEENMVEFLEKLAP